MIGPFLAPSELELPYLQTSSTKHQSVSGGIHRKEKKLSPALCDPTAKDLMFFTKTSPRNNILPQNFLMEGNVI